MNWGKQNRINRLFDKKSGKAIWLAIDHGYFLGPVSKLEKPGETIKPLLPYVTSLMLTKGVLKHCVDPQWDKGILLRVSGGNSVIGPDLANEHWITSVKEAIKLNVSAMALSIYVGSAYEHQSISNLSRLADAADDYDIPVLGVVAVGKELEKRDARYLSLATRIAAEMGADFVKTYYCEENFERVIETCPVPVVIAGGPKMETDRQVLEVVWNAINKGAAGIDMGRNVWQHKTPVKMIKAINEIVHNNGSVDDALEILNS